MKLDDHPTVKTVRERPKAEAPETLDAARLRSMALEAGAHDVGFVEIDRPEIADQKADILRAFPKAKALLSFVVRMSRENVRSPARSAANLEFHHTGDEVNDISRSIVARLEAEGVPAMFPSMGFPMEVDSFPSKIWYVSHKPVAEAAGLGKMGIHRNLIHPKFGNFILLGTVLLGAEVSEVSRPLDYNPCLECKLCVAACPVGAIGADGVFNFSSCFTHNYREFMGGFSDWVETVVESRSAVEYRKKVALPETVSVWQSLTYGANYKAAYCMAVCPAGEDVISPFLESRPQYLKDVVKPLQEKKETVYVVADSDAEDHVAKRFKNKSTKRVGNGLRPQRIGEFLGALPHVFQRGKAKGLDAVYHFTFTGAEEREATVVIRDQTIQVRRGLDGTPDLHVTADSETWLRFLAKETGPVWNLIRRKFRLKGPVKLLVAFGKCFPS